MTPSRPHAICMTTCVVPIHRSTGTAQSRSWWFNPRMTADWVPLFVTVSRRRPHRGSARRPIQLVESLDPGVSDLGHGSPTGAIGFNEQRDRGRSGIGHEFEPTPRAMTVAPVADERLE